MAGGTRCRLPINTGVSFGFPFRTVWSRNGASSIGGWEVAAGRRDVHLAMPLSHPLLQRRRLRRIEVLYEKEIGHALQPPP